MNRIEPIIGTLTLIGGLLVMLSSAFVAAPPCPAYTLTPIGQFANIRQEPTTDSRIVGQLKAGANVCATELSGNWYTLTDGGGYIRSDVVKATGTGAVPVTPTRIPKATATPIVINFFCPSACEGQVVIKELP